MIKATVFHKGFKLIEDELVPNLMSLEQNYPNPFRESTHIAFKLKQQVEVSLKVYDLFGREAAVLIDRKQRAAGKYVESFNPEQYNLSPGVYYFSLTNKEQHIKRKMILVD